MKSRTFTAGTSRTIVAVLDADDDVMHELQTLAAHESLSAASFTTRDITGHVPRRTVRTTLIRWRSSAMWSLGLPRQGHVIS
jgi:predicted DNA-binding protein with PD1-like motif